MTPRATLRLDGREVEVVVIPPPSAWVDVLTAPVVSAEGDTPMALGYCAAIGYFLEVGDGAGRDDPWGAMLSTVERAHGRS